MRTLNLTEVKASPVQQAVSYLQRNGETATLAAVLATMQIKPNNNIQTACTDAVKMIEYNPEWINTLPIPEVAGLLAHEAHHKFGMIHLRYEDWAPKYPGLSDKLLRMVFNWSHDYLINHSLKHDWNLPLPEIGMYNRNYHMGKYTIESLADKLLAEELKKNPPPPCGAGGKGGKSDQQGDGEGDEQGDDGNQEGDDNSEGESDSESDSDTSGEDQSDGDTSDGEGEDGDQGEGDQGEGDAEGEGEGAEGDGTPQPGDGGFGKGDDVKLPPDASEGVKGQGKPADGGARAESEVDVHVPMSESAKADMRAEIKRDMAECERMLNGLGIHAGDERTHGVFGDLTKVPVHSLRGELAKLAHKILKNKRSYTHPHRRRDWPTGVHKPGARADKIGTLVIYVDTSGSTSDQGWAYFTKVMIETLKGTKFDDVWVVHVDSEVEMTLHYDGVEFVSGKIDMDIYGGGGTQFHPAFQWAHDNIISKGKRIAAAIYFTDGQVGHSSLAESYRIWKQDQRYPLLWALWGDRMWLDTFINWVRDDKKFGATSVLPADAW